MQSENWFFWKSYFV